MYFPGPYRKHPCTSMYVPLLFHMGIPACLSQTQVYWFIFVVLLLNFLHREAALQALQSHPCSRWGHLSRGRRLPTPLSCPCRPRNYCWAAQTNRGTHLTKLWTSSQSAGMNTNIQIHMWLTHQQLHTHLHRGYTHSTNTLFLTHTYTHIHMHTQLQDSL